MVFHNTLLFHNTPISSILFDCCGVQFFPLSIVHGAGAVDMADSASDTASAANSDKEKTEASL